MGLLSGMAYSESQYLVEEVKKINKRLNKVESKLASIREIVYCPDCEYKKTCIHTSQGIERDGFCKWGVRKDGDGDACDG